MKLSSFLVVILALAGSHQGLAQPAAGPLVVDATVPAPPPETGYLRLGTSTAPNGHTLGVNSQYLTRDGQPWLPVMGEFHFSRFPKARWEEQLLKMKANGVQIVASYLFWIFHEEEQGKFNFSGDRDFRAFVQLCAKHHLLVLARIGPWNHAELRNGGFPDWLVKQVPAEALRSNAPAYLAAVRPYWQQLRAQSNGLLWKDGGPIIGIQLENEYNRGKTGQGAVHIQQLKEMALAEGFDVPFYTVTGWQGARYPEQEVLPVFGGYPDEPWGRGPAKMAPVEVYNFRFKSREGGNLGIQGGETAPRNNPAQLAHYPFLGAEFGGGVPVMYRRRPLLAPADVAAMLPVQLGSGVNLYGYYMFHGGRNPPGKLSWLQESSRTSSYNDLPRIGYDFQAPLGETGAESPLFAQLKLVHYFLNEFGPQLAPMAPHAPAVQPTNASDLAVPRWSVRTQGQSGFLFLNNYVRNYPMPARPGVQFAVQLPGETLTFPQTPVTVPAGSYFIWPFNLDLGGAKLKYATAQLFTKLTVGPEPYYVFFAQPGIPAELVFDAATVQAVSTPAGPVAATNGQVRVADVQPGPGVALTVQPRTGPPVQVLLLSEEQARQTWKAPLAGAERLVMTPQEIYFQGNQIHLQAEGQPAFQLGLFPALPAAPTGSLTLKKGSVNGLFQTYTATAPTRTISAKTALLKPAGTVPPIRFGGPAKGAVEPSDSTYQQAARWQLTLSNAKLNGLDDIILRFTYAGDAIRLAAGSRLLTDDFYNGAPWRVSYRNLVADNLHNPLTISVLPLRQDTPIYLEDGRRPTFPASGQVSALQQVEAIPRYRLAVKTIN
ncbi:beta-galactosidase [Hymenobacter sp. BT186]|uniref:Beta-galactosidase n=1 Tax=Hymenobacter telluris TaxID=2816474 RepID=A0A939EZV9_9BACT|nr:beta-galactosidase [Hymenobacter telluris]MBO0360555.1 beta-galactosidase [Hymenobacter telluris]MBW3376582.1 beta-galactosidase [Hymenobacter norwichensis]